MGIAGPVGQSFGIVEKNWTCPKCGNSNFGTGNYCHICREKKPLGGGGLQMDTAMVRDQVLSVCVLFMTLGRRSLAMARSDRSQNRQSLLHQHSHGADAMAASRRAGPRRLGHGLVRPRRSGRRAVHRVRPSKRAVPKAPCAEASGMDRCEPLSPRREQRVQHLVRSMGRRQLELRHGTGR